MVSLMIHLSVHSVFLMKICKCQKTVKSTPSTKDKYLKFPQGVKNTLNNCQEEDKATNRPYASRYIGSLVADFHRNLLKGGIYIYPSATNYQMVSFVCFMKAIQWHS